MRFAAGSAQPMRLYAVPRHRHLIRKTEFHLTSGRQNGFRSESRRKPTVCATTLCKSKAWILPFMKLSQITSQPPMCVCSPSPFRGGIAVPRQPEFSARGKRVQGKSFCASRRRAEGCALGCFPFGETFCLRHILRPASPTSDMNEKDLRFQRRSNICRFII